MARRPAGASGVRGDLHAVTAGLLGVVHGHVGLPLQQIHRLIQIAIADRDTDAAVIDERDLVRDILAPYMGRYLGLQGRFAHLFEPQRNAAELTAMQAKVDEYWADVAI